MSPYQAVKLMEDADDGHIRCESWMLHIAQAIYASVSYGGRTILGEGHPYSGSKSPRLALGLLLGGEEPQSFHCIEKSPWRGRSLLEHNRSVLGLPYIRKDNEPCGTVSESEEVASRLAETKRPRTKPTVPTSKSSTILVASCGQ